MKTPPRKLVCKFCGLSLSGPHHMGQRYTAKRAETPVSVTGIRCNTGECLNRAGQLTKHGPDSPEHNGGVDYSDGRSRYEPEEATAP